MLCQIFLGQVTISQVYCTALYIRTFRISIGWFEKTRLALHIPVYDYDVTADTVGSNIFKLLLAPYQP